MVRIRRSISEKNLKHEIETLYFTEITQARDMTISEKNLKHEIETYPNCSFHVSYPNHDQREESQA